MDKQELDLKLNEPIGAIASMLIGYLQLKFQDNPISDKVYKDLLISGGVNQLVITNMTAAANKVLEQLEQKVLNIGSGIDLTAGGQRMVAGFVDAPDNEPKPTPKPKEETRESYLKASLSLHATEYCPNCLLPLDNPTLCVNCGYRG